MQTAAQRVQEHPSALRLFDKAAFSAARYPHLLEVFDRMVAASLESLREVCSAPPQCVFKDVQTEELGEAVDATGGDGLIAVFLVPEWSGRLLFAVDRTFVHSATELLFGGDGLDPQVDTARPFSQIEKNVAKAVLTVVARSLQASLAASVPGINITFERIESDASLVMIDDRKSQAVVARFDLHAGGKTGGMQIVIPHSTVRSARARREATDEAGAHAGVWVSEMQNKIRTTDVKLRAVLEERRMTLGEISGLRVGQIIQLDTRTDSRIRLECDEEPFFLCEIGQSEGRYTLRVDKVLERAGGTEA
jgi:flagellar motor switch protein FliM